MAFLICVVLATLAFTIIHSQYQRRPLIPHLDSLKHGKNMFLVVGILPGILLTEKDPRYIDFDLVRNGVLNMGLIWFGLKLGLECSLRQLRQAQWHLMGGQIASAGFIVSFVILSILASGGILYEHLGLVSNLALAILFCTCFILSARYPEPTLRWRNHPTPATPDPTPAIPTHNLLAVGLLTLSFPILSSDLATNIGSYTFVGGFSQLALLGGLGFLVGSCLDFALRTHRNPTNGMATACCILIFFAGLSQSLNLPSISIGFIGGAWLVNTTVAKRVLLESLSRFDNILTPIFFIFVGTLIGDQAKSLFPRWEPLVPLVAMILIVRAMARTLGYSVSQYLWKVPESWRDTLELSARPFGPLSVALAIQALLVLDLHHNMLIAGLLTSTVLSQITLFPPKQNRSASQIATLQKD